MELCLHINSIVSNIINNIHYINHAMKIDRLIHANTYPMEKTIIGGFRHLTLLWPNCLQLLHLFTSVTFTTFIHGTIYANRGWTTRQPLILRRQDKRPIIGIPMSFIYNWTKQWRICFSVVIYRIRLRTKIVSIYVGTPTMLIRTCHNSMYTRKIMELR